MIKAAVVAVKDLGGKILLLSRPDHDPIHGFCLPGGKALKGETEMAYAAVRELAEETGIGLSVSDLHYVGHITSVIGYEISVYYAELDYFPMVHISSEHDGYAWVLPKKAQLLPLAGNTWKILYGMFAWQ